MFTVKLPQNEAIHWEKELIDKYDCRGPRYTSYPTADLFTPAFSDADYASVLDELKDNPFEPISLYLHIPFCQDICYYCACNKIVTRKKGVAEEYLDYLEKEMALLHEKIGHKLKVVQLHLGGGTPTFLDAGQMTRLIHTLSRYFYLTDAQSREYSIEIDPRTVCTDTLALLKGLGFNRVSLGVQDFSPEVQKAVNRVNSFEMVEDLMLAARDFGYNSINVDLIYGLPKQTPESLTKTIEQVVELGPDRIAFYNYAHLPDRFSSQRAIDRQTLPTPEQKLEMLNALSDQLTEAGYIYIGMDHFIKPDDALAKAIENGSLQRNFQGYSTCHAKHLIGLGMSSISSGENYFAQNARDIENYYQAIDEGRLPTDKGLFCDKDDLMRRAVIMSLIGCLALDIPDWEAEFGVSFYEYFADEIKELDEMAADQLLSLASDHIEILPKGRAMLRNICMAFDKYHGKNTQLFSKVI